MLTINLQNQTHLPLVVKLEPSFVVNFPTAAAVAGTLAASAGRAAGAAAAAIAVEGTVEAVLSAAATLGDSVDG